MWKLLKGIMAKRKVFGRRKADFGGQQFTIEMRTDGVFVRRKHCRGDWVLTFDRLLNHAQSQPDLFYDDQRQPEMFKPVGPSDPNEPLPSMLQGLVVPAQPPSEPDPLYANPIEPPESPQDGGNWMVPSAGHEQDSEERITPFVMPPAPIPNTVPTYDGPLENPDPPAAAAVSSVDPGGELSVPAESGGSVCPGTSGVGLRDD